MQPKQPGGPVALRPDSIRGPLVGIAAVAAFLLWLSGNMFATHQTMNGILFLASAAAVAAASFAYVRNFRLFIEGDRFGKVDLLGVRHAFALAEYAHTEWTGSRYPSMKFVSRAGRTMFVVNSSAWTSASLIGFARELDARKESASE